jgi:trehalose 6-phosphate phosphatase
VRVSSAATLVHALEPLRSDPPHGAVLLDVDGTLAPIVEHAEDARVPEATRALLIEVTKRYGLVACVSGRRAQAARQIVAIGSIAYIGNHGGELLPPGSTRPRLLDEAIAEWGERVAAFAESAYTSELRGLRVRLEDKGIIAAFHWRGARDEAEAETALRQLAESAQREGFAIHWGRKVLEVRPPVTLEKGRGIAALFKEVLAAAPKREVDREASVDANGGADPESAAQTDGGGDALSDRGPAVADTDQALSAAMYVGDDLTDLDAFRELRRMVEDGALKSSLCVAVASDEAPSELVEAADVVVDGPNEVRSLLAALL